MLILLLTSCAPKKEIPLELVSVTRGNIESSIPATGTVMPRNRLEIKPPVSGRIEQVLVAEGEAVRKGQIIALMSSLDRATLIDAARAKGEEEVRRWEEMYKPTPVIAPINGFIIQRSVEPGQTLTSNDVVLVMADKLIVKAQIDETDIGRIKLGQGVSIVLDAYPKDEVNGRVEHIAYESKVVSNVTVYEVDVIPLTVPDFFRAGMSATVNFSQNARQDVLVVPLKAIKKRGKSVYVWKPNADNKTAQAVQIETGLENGDNLEVLSGLTEGEKVVVPTKEMIEKLANRRGGPPNFNPFGSQRSR
ncbi:MAG: efflux RND transporter periplasmic adaptor subunit [Candidatus Margulisbacteria bacterium]|nr:efflux RND transporter periplasmic adaptor subunit [Candidatus Margulisiibacteriota bacterium]